MGTRCARAALRRTDTVRLAPAPIVRMGTRRTALHLDLFEQPGVNEFFGRLLMFLVGRASGSWGPRPE